MTRAQTTIAGLEVVWLGRNSEYAKVLHKASGKVAVKFASRPLPFGKREFIERLDRSSMNTLNWDRPEAELGGAEVYELIAKAKGEILP